jgi:hypothetical protein
VALGLYLDDCAFSHRLVQLLTAAGHTAVTPADAGTSGVDDDEHLRYAVTHGLTVLTKNCRDFLALHKQDNSHSGILGVYQDNDPNRDMNYQEIVDAVGRMEAAGLPIARGFHILNHWR